MKIVHFSDPHAGGAAEDWLAYFDKRWVGVFNYRFRRRFRHDLRNLEKAVTHILNVRPDVVVCTGDLTSTGQPLEFDKVRPLLEPLRDSAIPVVFVPGNHDCYVTRPKCVDAMREMVCWLTRDSYALDDLPTVRSHGGVEFIVINTSAPSNLLCSWGFLTQATRNWLEAYCSTPKNCPRVLVTHYPIAEHNHPVWRIRHRLFGAAPVKKMLEDQRLDLVLCGHVHKPYQQIDDSGRGESCAGSVTRNGTLSEIEYDAADSRFVFRQIALQRLTGDGTEFH